MFVVALLGGGGAFAGAMGGAQNDVQAAVLETQLEAYSSKLNHVVESIDDLESAVNIAGRDRYTRSEAVRDLSALQDRITELERRWDRSERSREDL